MHSFNWLNKHSARKLSGIFAALLSVGIMGTACAANPLLKQGVTDANVQNITERIDSGSGYSDKNKKIDLGGETSDVSAATSARERNMSLAQAATRSSENENGEHPLTTMEISAKVSPSVVAISTTGTTQTVYGNMPYEGAGSGVIVSADGYIVTNNHVIDGASSIVVILASGEKHKASLVGAVPKNDLAVLKIEAKDLPAVKVGNSDDLLVGELVVAVGNPLGDFQGTVTVGVVSSLGRTLVLNESGELVELTNLVQTDAAINQGNSGGGLFNSYGELIGINVAKAGSSSNSGATVEGLGFAIPTNTAAPIIEAIVNEGGVKDLPSLNIMGSAVSAEMAQYYSDRLVKGVMIRDIAEGSCVLKAGMKVGDIITKFDGEQIQTVAQLNMIKNRHKAGDSVAVEYYREGKANTTTVVLDTLKQ